MRRTNQKEEAGDCVALSEVESIDATLYDRKSMKLYATKESRR